MKLTVTGLLLPAHLACDALVCGKLSGLSQGFGCQFASLWSIIIYSIKDKSFFLIFIFVVYVYCYLILQKNGQAAISKLVEDPAQSKC